MSISISMSISIHIYYQLYTRTDQQTRVATIRMVNAPSSDFTIMSL